jgi:hypothetical protein
MAQALAADADAAAVGLDELLDDGQPRSQATARAVAGRVALREAVEHERQEVGGDALPGVDDLDAQPLGIFGEHGGHHAASGRELDRVGRQVPDHLLQPQRIGADQPVRRVLALLEADVLVLERRLQRAQRGDQLLRRIDHREGQRQLAQVQARHVEQVGDHAGRGAAVALDGGQAALGLVGAAALLQHMRRAQDRVERRAQLMRQDGDEVVLHAAGLLGLAACDALAIQPLHALALQLHPRRDVGGHHHRDARLDLRGDVPFHVDEMPVGAQHRQLLGRLRRRGHGKRVDPERPLGGCHRAEPVSNHLVETVAQERQHRGVGVGHHAVVADQRDAAGGLRIDRLELGFAALRRHAQLLGLVVELGIQREHATVGLVQLLLHRADLQGLFVDAGLQDGARILGALRDGGHRRYLHRTIVMGPRVASAKKRLIAVVQQREPALHVQRRAHAGQRQPELDQRDGHRRLHAHHHRGRVQHAGDARDARQHAADERVDDLERGDVDQHAGGAGARDLERQVVLQRHCHLILEVDLDGDEQRAAQPQHRDAVHGPFRPSGERSSSPSSSAPTTARRRASPSW